LLWYCYRKYYNSWKQLFRIFCRLQSWLVENLLTNVTFTLRLMWVPEWEYLKLTNCLILKCDHCQKLHKIGSVAVQNWLCYIVNFTLWHALIEYINHHMLSYFSNSLHFLSVLILHFIHMYITIQLKCDKKHQR